MTNHYVSPEEVLDKSTQLVDGNLGLVPEDQSHLPKNEADINMDNLSSSNLITP